MSSKTYEPKPLTVHEVAMRDAAEQFRVYHDTDASYRIYLYSVIDQVDLPKKEKAKIYAAVR